MASAAETGPQLIDRFHAFFNKYYRQDILEFADRYPNEQQSLTVSWGDLYQFEPDLADDLLTTPDDVLEHAEEALRTYDIPVDIGFDNALVRIDDLHPSHVFNVGEYRADEVNTLIGIRGIVNKATGVLPAPDEIAFECGRCGSLSYIPQRSGFQEPHECQGCQRQGPFSINYEQSEFHDYRLIRLQLPPDESMGAHSDTIDVVLEHDLVDAVDPGDRVVIPAVLRIDKEDGSDEKSFSLHGEAKGAQVLETDFDDIDIEPEEAENIETIAKSPDPYQRLVDSFCPKVKGYEDVKEAILLQLFGGVTKKLGDGSVERGISHIFLVGDPGTAKSTLIEYAADIAPRSVYTNGKGSSAAGLTASAVRDDFGPGGEWSIEGGAIVKADKGLAAIDELDKMSDEDRDSLHEAMEQMQVSVAKAGLTPTLSARTTLLAAANPVEGRFDQYAPIGEQIDLDPALISRFDLIFTFKDSPDEDQDRKIISHKTDVWEVGARRASQNYRVEDATDVEPDLDKDFLRKYIAYAKNECSPVPTAEAKEMVEEQMIALRMANNGDDDEPVPVTLRKQEALQRIAEASARVRLSDTVEKHDVSRAVRLVRSCLEDVGVDPETGELDADVVETGRSTTQRDRVRTLLAIVEEVDKETDHYGAHLDRVYELMESEGHDRSSVTHAIENLKDSGDAYHPDDAENYLELT